jgi:hypothetical protein
MQEVDMKELDKWRRLEFELLAIEFWDANYRADTKRHVDDICAFSARQVRKEQILQEMGRKAGS